MLNRCQGTARKTYITISHCILTYSQTGRISQLTGWLAALQVPFSAELTENLVRWCTKNTFL